MGVFENGGCPKMLDFHGENVRLSTILAVACPTLQEAMSAIPGVFLGEETDDGDSYSPSMNICLVVWNMNGL